MALLLERRHLGLELSLNVLIAVMWKAIGAWYPWVFRKQLIQKQLKVTHVASAEKVIQLLRIPDDFLIYANNDSSVVISFWNHKPSEGDMQQKHKHRRTEWCGGAF